MKKLFLIIGVALLSITAFCQDDEFQTIFGEEEFRITGFGGPLMSFNTIGGEFAHLMGGGGGIIINNRFMFGGYGLGKTTRLLLDSSRFDNLNFANRYLNGNTSKIQSLEIDFGHGGLFAGYIFNGNAAIHPAFWVQFGWGSVDITDSPGYYVITDNSFVLTPVLELEMNFTKFMRIGVGANYTMVSGVTIDGYKSNDFSSPGAFLSFTFGWF